MIVSVYVYGASNTQNIVLILGECASSLSFDWSNSSKSTQNVMNMTRFPTTKKENLQRKLQWSYIAIPSN